MRARPGTTSTQTPRMPWRRSARRRALAAAEAELARRRADARFVRALGGTWTEREAMAVLVDTLDEFVGHTGAQALLVEAEGDGWTEVATSAGMQAGTGCPATACGHCRAAMHGTIERFTTSEVIDACPLLQGRADGPTGALCVPLTIAGRNAGVLHVTTPEGRTTAAVTTLHIATLAAQAADRVALLRTVDRANEEATTDALTGAANRRSLETRVRGLLERDEAFALVIADIDEFKQINDSEGHDAGDQALQAFAEAMRRSLRPEDMVARFGGDEFVMVITGCNAEQAVPITERVRAEFRRVLAGARLAPATASFGIADDTAGNTLPAIFTAADDALLDAKRGGRNRIVAVPSIPHIDLVDPSFDAA